MTLKAELTGHKLSLDIHELLGSIALENKLELIEALGIQSDVIEETIKYLCGESVNWTSDEGNMRQRLLERVEKAQLLCLPRYSWEPWSALTQALKDIKCKQHIYWKLYHHGPNFSETAAGWLIAAGVESNFTTKEADADIAAITKLVQETLKAMVKPEKLALTEGDI